MNRTLSSRRCHQIRASLCLLVVALIAGVTGCVGEASSTVKYDLTIASGQGGSVTVPGQGTFTCDAGRVVDLLATPTSGYRFASWTGDVGTIANPYAASTTITVSSNYSVTASFEQAEGTYYTLTMGVSGSGSVSPTAGSHTYGAGAVISITATPAIGYQFDGWSGDMGAIANVNAASTTITMNNNYSIIANFEQTEGISYTLTTTANPSGGGSVSPSGGTYPSGSQLTLTATAASGYTFSHWAGDATGSQNPITITMNSNKSITAYFTTVQYTLTTSVSPSGGGSVSPSGGTYPSGSQLTLTATAASGYTFSHWAGDATGSQNPITITMNSNKSITAYFTTVQYTLTTSVSPSGGGSVSPSGGTYPSGSQLTLTATAASGYTFSHWAGDATGSQNPITITMNDDHSITANFAAGDGLVFPDPKLEAALRAAIGKPTGHIYESDLEGLTSFSATGKTITDLTGLEHCTELVSLDLRDNKISDISPLAGLTNLEWLDLSYNRINSISPLAGLTSLKWLYLYNNQIASILPLANLTNLTYLFIYMNQISDISFLANLTNLTRLLLFSNQISDISPLANLTKLNWLYLQKNQISDISDLANLTSLTQLDLSDNEIGGIGPMANLINLIYLSLHSNQISDISLLANFPELMWLYLQNNNIGNIYPLVQNSGLGTGDRVYLNGNPLSEDSVNTYVPELVARGVIVYAD
jgi:Leucine-rich repeat (LRR) protein